MLAQLRQLHPMPGRKSVFAVAMFMGLAIALFLIVFQPFGINTIPFSGRKLAILAGYGVITIGVVCLNGIVLPAAFPGMYATERWTLGKDILLLGLVNFAMVTLANFLYTSWAFGFDFTVGSLLFSLIATLSVGFLPFTILVLYRHNRLLQQNLQSAAIINAHIPAPDTAKKIPEAESPVQEKVIILSAEGGGEGITFSADDLLYAESADNYIKVTTLVNGTAKTATIRQTLKHLEDLAETEKHIARCHRSFIVNMRKVTHAEGNAQGLRLEMEGCEAIVPVSRTYVSTIKSLLNTP